MRTTWFPYSASVCAWPVRSLRARGGAAGSFQGTKRARSAPTLPASPSARQTAAPRIRRRADRARTATVVTVPAAIRPSRRDLARGDRVLEAVGVETVATALRGLGQTNRYALFRLDDSTTISDIGRTAGATA